MDRIAFFDELRPAYKIAGGMCGGMCMSKPTFVKEHVNLIGILKKGTRREREREAADQSRELLKVVGGASKALGAGKRAIIVGYVKKLRAFFTPYGLDKKSMDKLLSDFKKVLMTIHKRRPDLTIKEFKEKTQEQFDNEIEEEENEEEEEEDEGPEDEDEGEN